MMASIDVFRLRADFPENIWGERFAAFSLDQEVYQMYAKDIEMLKEEVRTMLMAAPTESNIVEKLNFIDTIERLGIAYHFQEEIEKKIEQIFNMNSSFEDYDLCTTSLFFRIFRQHGYKISCGIFDKFLDENGKFEESLSADIKGMMSLFEAAQVRTHGDCNILEEAHAFTKTMRTEQVGVNHTLDQSLHKGVSRVEARHYIMVYEEDEFKNEQLLRLAKIDYNFLQMLHKQELSNLLKWWKELNISKLPYIRDRLVECYFWALIVYFEPHYSFNRINLTKIIVVISVLDDTYDAYGTLDELSNLTDLVQRWEGGENLGLTDCIKTCFLGLMQIYNEVVESLAKEGSSLGVHHLKEAIKQYSRSSNIEAKWLLRGELPPFAEYLSNASITISYYVLLITSMLGMKCATKEVFDWIETSPRILVSSMEISRLANDVASHKFEKKRGNATGIDCYMKHYNVSEHEAMDKFEKMIEEKWREINEEQLKSIFTVPREILITILNLCRSLHAIYKHRDDGYTEPQKVIVPYIVSTLLDPVVL